MNRSLILRLLTGAALVGIAVVHLRIAGSYAGLGKTPLALNQQFYGQAVVAFLLTAALLVKPHPLVWLVTAGFAAGSLAVLIYSRYKCLPIYGFDGCFQESWSVQGAKPAAWFEAAALALTSAGLATSLHGASLPRRGHRTAASI